MAKDKMKKLDLGEEILKTLKEIKMTPEQESLFRQSADYEKRLKYKNFSLTGELPEDNKDNKYRITSYSQLR